MKFIIADNQDITRLGITSLINETFDDNVQVVCVDSYSSLMSLLDGDDNGVIVIVDCMGNNGDTHTLRSIDDIQELAHSYPYVMWILFSNEIPETFARRFAAEAKFSILLKDAHSEEVISALKLASMGERFICHHITNMLLNAPRHETINELTETEVEILKLTALGKTVKEIASERNSSVHTITTHKRNIFRKLGINTSYEATRYAMRAGLIDLVEYYI